MGKYNIFYLFEKPRRGMQARNFITNVPKILDLKSSSEQIFPRKLSLGAPDQRFTSETFIPCEAKFIMSSRAKGACITQASQGQRDFLLAINLSSLVGVRLDVIQ